MKYNKRFLENGSYVIEEVQDSGWIRTISERQPDFLSWVYEGGKPTVIPYVPPVVIPPTLDEAKKSKRMALMRHRDEVIGEGFTYGAFVFPLDADIQTTMLMTFQSSQLMPAPSYSWKDKDGVYREIGNAAAFQAFAFSAMMYGQSLYAREEMLQGVVNKAATVAEVEAITWDTVPQ